MGVQERKEREKEERRNQIIDAAESVFFSKGRENTTMEEIAEEAELSKGTLYLYFNSKQDLYLSINTRGLKILGDMFEEAFESKEKGIDKIEAIGRTYIDFYKQYPNYFFAMVYYESHEINFEEENSCARECHDYGERVLGFVAKAIQVGVEDGSIRPDLDPYTISVSLWGQTTGLIQIVSLKGEHLKEKHNIDLDNLVDCSFNLFRTALENREQ